MKNYRDDATASQKSKLKSMVGDESACHSGKTERRAGGGATWGDWNGPMPVNKDGADYSVRVGNASGPGDFGKTDGKYEMNASDFKMKKRASGGDVSRYHFPVREDLEPDMTEAQMMLRDRAEGSRVRRRNVERIPDEDSDNK